MTAADTAKALVPTTVLVRCADSFMVSAKCMWHTIYICRNYCIDVMLLLSYFYCYKLNDKHDK